MRQGSLKGAQESRACPSQDKEAVTGEGRSAAPFLSAAQTTSARCRCTHWAQGCPSMAARVLGLGEACYRLGWTRRSQAADKGGTVPGKLGEMSLPIWVKSTNLYVNCDASSYVSTGLGPRCQGVWSNTTLCMRVTPVETGI